MIINLLRRIEKLLMPEHVIVGAMVYANGYFYFIIEISGVPTIKFEPFKSKCEWISPTVKQEWETYPDKLIKLIETDQELAQAIGLSWH